MNQLQKDIIETIRRHGPMTTAEICEYLEPLGYGGNMSFDDFKRWIGKTTSKLRGEGHVTGEDRPNPGTKPVRYWALPEAAGAVQDLGDVETHQDSRTYSEQAGEWSDAKTFEAAPECTEWKKLLPSRPMSAAKILREFANLGMEDDRAMGVFMDGIAAAERHHGIGE